MNSLMMLGLIIFSQYFGQNKIQYKDFDFRVLETEHFNIYFYQGCDELAAFAETVLEDGYAMLSDDLGMEIDFTIPAIIYNSPNDFSQTNITLELIEEATGGFSEILKNRMVVPFTGDYEEFRHVLVHELTHIFQFAIFFPSRLEAIFSGDILYSIPLWVFEGHCEFMSQGWDVGADIFVRDLVINNKLIPIYALGGYGGLIVYKEGQAFYKYVAEKYGREKVGEFLHLMKMKRNLEPAFMAAFGVTPEEFDKRWLRYYQMQYWPEVDEMDYFDNFGRIIYDHKKTNSIYNVSPAISPNGDKIAFISDQGGIAQLLVVSSIDGRLIGKLVKSAYSAGYEGLHLYHGGLSWSRDGEYITFAAKSRGDDVLYVVSAADGKAYRRMKFDLTGIYSPRFSPDGKRIIFTGLRDSYSDIYVCDIETGILENITNDIYSESFPDILSDDLITFISDRPDSNEDYYYGQHGLFLYEHGEISRISPRSKYLASATFAPDGSIYFVADYDSAYNLYYYSKEEGKVSKRTDVFSGIYYPSISADGNKMAFSYYNDYGYDVCIVKDALTKMLDYTAVDSVKIAQIDYYTPEPLDDDAIKKYKPRFTFDYFSASAEYFSVLGFSGVTQIGVSDILGNHHFQFASNFYGSILSSDIFVNYWYLKKRTDFGFGVFQYLNYFSDGYDLLVWRYLGLGGGIQYPFDRFFRLELGMYAYKLYETRWLNYFPLYSSNWSQTADYNFFYPEVALVFDNIKYGPLGPHDGRRFRIGGYATIFSNKDLKSAVLDYRRYFALSPRASFASRLVLAGSFGEDLDYWSIGGPYSLRGYDYYAFTGSKIGFMNLEFRFPFIDRLSIAFPIPLEIRNIRADIFADFGAVHTDSFKFYETDGGFRLKDLKLGVGAGLRFTFMYIIFRLDFARAHNLKGWYEYYNSPTDFQRSEWKFYLTLSPDW
ncbi:MAG: PD40 domain-containing protein [candidate division WOR-3 bacterium]|nr:MAG: PD40 domain-containing protein [candidate division WOR-3 bacterium]